MSVATITPSTKNPGRDLDARVENRKRELISEIIEHKKNSCRAGAAEAIDKAKARLTELAYIVKEGGGPSARLKLADWMER
ncbi:MAG TPA: hypothetical protein VIU61_29170 [Kofleriaceae bacterium]